MITIECFSNSKSANSPILRTSRTGMCITELCFLSRASPKKNQWRLWRLDGCGLVFCVVRALLPKALPMAGLSSSLSLAHIKVERNFKLHTSCPTEKQPSLTHCQLAEVSHHFSGPLRQNNNGNLMMVDTTANSQPLLCWRDSVNAPVADIPARNEVLDVRNNANSSSSASSGSLP